MRVSRQWTVSRLLPLLVLEGWDLLQKALLQQVPADTAAGLQVYLRQMDEAGNSSSSVGSSSNGSSSSISEYNITLQLVSSIGAELPYNPAAVAAAVAAEAPTIVRLPLQPHVVLVSLSTQPSTTCLAFSRQEFEALDLQQAVLRYAILPGGELQPLPCQGMLQQPDYVALWQDGELGCQLVGLLRVGDRRLTNCSALKQQVLWQYGMCVIRDTISDPQLKEQSDHQLQFCEQSKLLDPSFLRSFRSKASSGSTAKTGDGSSSSSSSNGSGSGSGSSSGSPSSALSGEKRVRETAGEQPLQPAPKKGSAAVDDRSSRSIISKLSSSAVDDAISSSILGSSSAPFPLLALQAVKSPHAQAELMELLERNPIFIDGCALPAKRAYRTLEQLLDRCCGRIAHVMLEVIVDKKGLQWQAAPLALLTLMGRKYGLGEGHGGRPHNREQQSAVICLTTNATKPCGGGGVGGESCSTAPWQQPCVLVPPSSFSRAAGLQQLLEGDVPVYAVLYCSPAKPRLLAVLPVTGGHTQQPVAGRVVKTAKGLSPKLLQATDAYCRLLWAGLHFALSERGQPINFAVPDSTLPASLPDAFDSSDFIQSANDKLQELKASVHCTLRAVTDCALPLVAAAEAAARKDKDVIKRLKRMKRPLACVRAAPLLVGQRERGIAGRRRLQ